MPSIAQFLHDHALTISYKYIPYQHPATLSADDTSQACLKWQVTLSRNSTTFLITEYTKGNGHCQAAKNPIKFENGRVDKWGTNCNIVRECTSGLHNGKPVPTPLDRDVMIALLLDCSVLGFSFENWVKEVGYSPDSRQAEAIYLACQKTALAFITVLGLKGLHDAILLAQADS